MSKCHKVKNPCKICLSPVTYKTGLQCQGVCESWVHYACLSYTPGRIQDIKNGIIKVTCPCPDCKTTLPKEYRTDDKSFSCTNDQCPANQPPRCENKMCPVNLQFPSVQDVNANPQTCPLTQCGNECKKFSSTQLHQGAQAQGNPNQGAQAHQGNPHQGAQAHQGKPCQVAQPPQGNPYQMAQAPQGNNNYYNQNFEGAVLGNPCGLPIQNQGGQVYASYFSSNTNSSSSSPSETPPNYRDIPGDMNHVFSDTSLSAVEQMCNTVGQLTNQINDLMCKMKQAVNPNGPTKGCYPQNQNTCSQKGPKSKCPKPCFCPGNPGNRR